MKVISGVQAIRQGTVRTCDRRFPADLKRGEAWFLYIARPQQRDLRLPGPPSDQGAGGGARTRDRKVPADLRADSLATEPPTP
ncbi:hypothetical protein PoB_005435300 [Plakobranchus ocellatus]|uniref:Uncharacterized protein n=1 Tax=Plakobranchus ocellatus TaxID=259542 RepID=A0AAV4C7K0_9GAST|nr:hypothetical protein PoB_005435300 [Plakobranchus ocellatus]